MSNLLARKPHTYKCTGTKVLNTKVPKYPKVLGKGKTKGCNGGACTENCQGAFPTTDKYANWRVAFKNTERSRKDGQLFRGGSRRAAGLDYRAAIAFLQTLECILEASARSLQHLQRGFLSPAGHKMLNLGENPTVRDIIEAWRLGGEG